MNAILILIGLFSLTLIFSQSKFLQKANAFSFLSVPILVGFLFSDQGLIPFLPSTKENLLWALRVALLWMAFVSGIRVSEQARHWRDWLSLIPFLFGYILFLEVTIIGLRVFGAPTNPPLEWEQIMNYLLSAQFGLAIILSASIFSSKENPFLLSLVVVGLWLSDQFGVDFTFYSLGLPIGIGLILALVFWLIVSGTGPLEIASRLTLLGLCILGSGWAFGLNSMEVFVGLAFGVSLAILMKKRKWLEDPVLTLTETPVRLIVAFFVGVELSFSVGILQLGLLLAVGRLLIKWFLLRAGLRNASSEVVLFRILPMPSLALPLLLCLHFAGATTEASQYLLSVFAVAFIANDSINLGLEFWRRELRPSRGVSHG